MTSSNRDDGGAALYVTSRNSDVVLGIPWETALAVAQRHGVQILTIGPRRRMIPAAELVRAIQAEHERQLPSHPLTEREEVDALLHSWGLQRRQ
jgi:hypothetical protein